MIGSLVQDIVAWIAWRLGCFGFLARLDWLETLRITNKEPSLQNVNGQGGLPLRS